MCYYYHIVIKETEMDNETEQERKRYQGLAENDYSKASAIMNKAKDQIYALLALPPKNMNPSEVKTLVMVAKETVKAGEALEERVFALQAAGQFDKKSEGK